MRIGSQPHAHIYAAVYSELDSLKRCEVPKEVITQILIASSGLRQKIRLELLITGIAGSSFFWHKR